LFELLTSAELYDAHECAHIIYRGPVKNLDAYQSLRGRLLQSLAEYVAEQRQYIRHTPKAEIFVYLHMAEFLIEKNCGDPALHFLQKAEDIADFIRHYEFRHLIYRLKIENAALLGCDIEDIAHKWDLNGRRLGMYRHLVITSARARKVLEQSRLTGVVVDPNEVMAQTFSKISLDVEEANDPNYLLAIAQAVRSVFIPTKNYQRIDAFVSRYYNRILSHSGFGPADRDVQVSFLYMLAHARFRNRLFDSSEQLLNEMEALLPGNAFSAHPYYAKAISLRATLMSYTHRVNEAIALMTTVIDPAKKRSYITDRKERYNVRLNLAVAHFHENDFRKAFKTIQLMGHKDAWLGKHLGREWLYKKQLIELIIQVELGRADVATAILRHIRGEYSDFLSQPIYQRAAQFMDFVALYLDDPNMVTTPEFQQKVKAAGLGWGDMEDVQAITFFCWLRSKMTGKPYYEVLLERLAEEVEI